MSDAPQDVLVVVRSAGERTADAAVALLGEVFAPDAVLRIEERPFARAVRRTFELGAASGRAFTLATDADVLVDGAALLAFVEQARRLPPPAFQLQGRVADKLFGGFRHAGPRIYRSRLLELALGYVPADGVALRPESDAMLAMAAAGHPYERHPGVLGLHGFEQFYRDLHRAGRALARKHAPHVEALWPLWERLGVADPDFRLVQAGARAASGADAGQAIAAAGLEEKAPLPAGRIGPAQVERALAGFCEQPEARRWRALGRRAASPRPPLWRRLRRALGTG